mgnify:CR=1 FL=1
MAVKRTLEGMVEAGEPLMRQALQAIRDAQAAETLGLAKHELERLHYWRTRFIRPSLTFSL